MGIVWSSSHASGDDGFIEDLLQFRQRLIAEAAVPVEAHASYDVEGSAVVPRDRARMGRELADINDRILRSLDGDGDGDNDTLHIKRADLLRFAANFAALTSAADNARAEHQLAESRDWLRHQQDDLTRREARLRQARVSYLQNVQELQLANRAFEQREAALSAREAKCKRAIDFIRKQRREGAEQQRQRRNAVTAQCYIAEPSRHEEVYAQLAAAAATAGAASCFSGGSESSQSPAQLPPQNPVSAASASLPTTNTTTTTTTVTTTNNTNQNLAPHSQQQQQQQQQQQHTANPNPARTASTQTQTPTAQTIRDMHSSIYTTTFRLAFEMGRRSAPQVARGTLTAALGELRARIEHAKQNWAQIVASGGMARALEDMSAAAASCIAQARQDNDADADAAADAPDGSEMMTFDEMCELSLGSDGGRGERIRRMAGVSDVLSGDYLDT